MTTHFFTFPTTIFFSAHSHSLMVFRIGVICRLPLAKFRICKRNPRNTVVWEYASRNPLHSNCQSRGRPSDLFATEGFFLEEPRSAAKPRFFDPSPVFVVPAWGRDSRRTSSTVSPTFSAWSLLNVCGFELECGTPRIWACAFSVASPHWPCGPMSEWNKPLCVRVSMMPSVQQRDAPEHPLERDDPCWLPGFFLLPRRGTRVREGSRKSFA